MMFVLGVLVGIVAVIAIVVVESYLVPRRKGLVGSIVEKVEKGTKPKAQIFFPKTDQEVAQDSLIESNTKKGRDTNLEDLGL